MTLHTIAKTTVNTNLILPNDVVLFWQDGVILALKNSIILKQILSITPYCYALSNDILARGLISLIDQQVVIIEMADVVQLTVQHYPQLAW